jgi:Flp pilus assembly protein TadD
LLGQLYVSQKKLDQAIAEYEEIARQETNPVAARTLVAMLMEAQGKQAEARRRYEEILRLDPNAPVAANNLAYIYADAGGNLDVALQLVQTAKQKLPELPEVDDTLGFVYLKKDLASLAVPPLESSVQKDPANSLYQYHLGMAYVRTGEKAKAKSALERALKLNPSFSGADDARRLLATVTP